MPLYTVTRPMPGITEADLNAAAVRAVICSYEYPGMRWIRSFWNHATDELLCIYEAASPEQVRDHAERSRIPCGEVTEVEEIRPEQFIAVATGSAGERATPAGAT